MAGQTTTYGDISQRTAVYAMVDMLSHAEPVLVLSKFGKTHPLPKNKADNAKFRRVIPASRVNVPLVEGVTPTAQKLAYEDVAVQMRQWGAYFEISDYVHDTSEDPVLRDMSQQCGEQAARTTEAICWGVIRAGTAVYRANGAAQTDINTPITLAKQRAVVRYLKNQKAKKVTKMLSPSEEYATRSVEPAYVAFCHTNVESDIRNMAGFIPVAQYGSRQPLCPEELGAVEDVRYISSPDLDYFADAGGNYADSGTAMVTTTGTKADVFPVVYIGMESYGHVPLKGRGAISPKVLNPDTPRGGDPLGQRGSVGWKAYYQAVILNDTWMARLEVAATELA
ncbi:N4-gp56 family major capsid protein [Thalassobaculum sp.]|uniref:N4-gp56 family major capsid protein n=1 Tax=Thalassobaculum sp. TaxID=2022740 RepID=UPI0032EA915B